MDVIPIGELKANFSTILGRIKKGEKIIISFGKHKERLAILSPYAAPKGPKKRKLGLLKGKAAFLIGDDFKIRDEELLSFQNKMPLISKDKRFKDYRVSGLNSIW